MDVAVLLSGDAPHAGLTASQRKKAVFVRQRLHCFAKIADGTALIAKTLSFNNYRAVLKTMVLAVLRLYAHSVLDVVAADLAGKYALHKRVTLVNPDDNTSWVLDPATFKREKSQAAENSSAKAVVKHWLAHTVCGVAPGASLYQSKLTTEACHAILEKLFAIDAVYVAVRATVDGTVEFGTVAAAVAANSGASTAGDEAAASDGEVDSEDDDCCNGTDHSDDDTGTVHEPATKRHKAAASVWDAVSDASAEPASAPAVPLTPNRDAPEVPFAASAYLQPRPVSHGQLSETESDTVVVAAEAPFNPQLEFDDSTTRHEFPPPTPYSPLCDDWALVIDTTRFN